MNKRIVIRLVSYILILEAVLMVIPMVVSAIYGEGEVTGAFILSIVISIVTGACLYSVRPHDKVIYAKEGFLAVALSWIFLSVFGSLPFLLSGAIPNFFTALFETASGFTTTGATALTDVEALGYGLLFWRSFTHWIGGMGVLVFVLVILPLGGDRNMHLMRAEVPGPTAGKLVPRMKDTAKILYGIYLSLTILEIVILFIGKMPLFDCFINAFGCAGTGGFSNWNNGIAHYNSAYAEIVMGVFMLIFGINFNLYYMILIRRMKSFFKNEELRVYLAVVCFAVLTIALNIKARYEDFGTALRHAFFHVSSIITTSGFTTDNYENWGSYAQMLLFLLMLLGACAGSTAGGLKVSRVMLLFRNAKRGIHRLIHPRSIEIVHIDGKMQEETVLQESGVYLTIYCFIMVASMLVIAADGFDIKTNISTVVTCFNNVGPGFGAVGPTGNFASYSWWAKLILTFDMLAGRLEIFPILILFAPSFWHRARRRGRECERKEPKKRVRIIR